MMKMVDRTRRAVVTASTAGPRSSIVSAVSAMTAQVLWRLLSCGPDDCRIHCWFSQAEETGNAQFERMRQMLCCLDRCKMVEH